MSRILVIDDDLVVLEAIKMGLSDYDYDITTESDGTQVVDVVRNGKFDLIVTDILMPDYDGFEVIRSLKKEFPDLKILAISGGGNMGGLGYLEVAKKLGADAAVQKPVNLNDLVESVKALIG